jgi:predicted phosphohydrolase
MKIYYGSDLHLEFRTDCPKIPTDGDILLLNGDIIPIASIIIYLDLFKEISFNFEKVYYVLGNHEYYHGDFNIILGDIRTFFTKHNINNIIVLNNDYYKLNNEYYVFGSTLWTDFKNCNPLIKYYYSHRLNDCRQIKNINSEIIYSENKKAREFIKESYEEIKKLNKKLIVMTHHAPSVQCIHPKYKNSGDMNYYYANTRLIEDYCYEDDNIITKWLFGHCHNEFNFTEGSINIFSNPMGYPGENKKEYEFKCFEI